jgi:hypothetical protein
MANSINGKDLKAIFGTVILKNGSDTFLAFPKRKDSLNHDYPEESGIDIDLSAPEFAAREFTLKVALLATDRPDYWSKYNGLFTELSQAGTHTLHLEDLGKDFLIYYKAQTNVTKLVRLNNGANVGSTFDLVFGEADPRSNIEAVYLGTDTHTYLIV